MKRSIAEWLWRAAVISALVWIGWELHRVHEDMFAPVDDQTTVTAGSDDTERGMDEMRADVAELHDKVDALMMAMARSRSMH
jgi:hypothetical protein